MQVWEDLPFISSLEVKNKVSDREVGLICPQLPLFLPKRHF